MREHEAEDNIEDSNNENKENDGDYKNHLTKMRKTTVEKFDMT